ncbi:MAG: AAA family ATPase [Sulfurimonas sp.]
MDKENLYQQINQFNSKYTDPSDKGSKSFSEAYLYVNEDEAIDKAGFIKELIMKGYLSDSYEKILDLTFGSGSLTSHIVFDNDITYEKITFNDINRKKTNQKLDEYIEDSIITNNDILDNSIYKSIEADLVIINPQIGGNYTYGNILNQKKDSEKNDNVLDNLYYTLKRFYDNDSTIIFYGQDKDFDSLLDGYNFYKYMSDSKQNLFVINKEIKNNICFQKKDNIFLVNENCLEVTDEDEQIESFDDMYLITEEFSFNEKNIVTNNEEAFKKWWYSSTYENSDGKKYEQPTKNAYFNGIKRLIVKLNDQGENIDVFSINKIEYVEKINDRLKTGDLKTYNVEYGYNASNGLKQYIRFLQDTNNNSKEVEKSDFINFSNVSKGNLDFPHKNILFKGVPGTGKSKTVDNIIKDKDKLDMQELSDNILRINIHSASSNSDLMQGISISTDEKQNILYKEKRGSVLKHIIKAIYRPYQPFALVLEEIQENSLNELIGDLIYLIEDTKRTKVRLEEQTLSYDELIKQVNPEHFVELPSLVENNDINTKMIIPDNLYIFCTSNYRDDKKVIEDNLLRRFDVIEMYPKNQEELDKEDGKFIFKSKEASDFLEKLNKEILTAFNDETHPDRNIIGHANWLNITDEENDKNRQLFYKALLKVVIEFKEIREVEFESFVQPILSVVFKKQKGLSQTIEKYLDIFYTDGELKLSTYKEMVDKLQKEIYSSFI